jgi:acyl-coenzyme A thioesterase PaaI-like protein
MMSDSLEAILDAARRHRDVAPLIEAIPYARFLGIPVDVQGDEITTCMRYRPELSGHPQLPAVPGGTLGALLAHASIFQLLWAESGVLLPQLIHLTVAYLRSARPQDTDARAFMTKHGRRGAQVHAIAGQDYRDRPMAPAPFLWRSPSVSSGP